MKTFFLLSDINQGILITVTGGIITAILVGLIFPLLLKIFNKVGEVHKEFDGMKDELVNATKLLGEATGKAKGREELKQEQKDETSTPSEVVIVENKAPEVIIKRNLDK